MKKSVLFGFLASVIVLGACDGVQETVGLTKDAPDEFQVVRRAPLTLPPNYVLRPPRPGAPRPQEQTTAEEAASTIFGLSPEQVSQDNIAPTSGEGALLKRAGSDVANPNIRDTVDSETAELFDRNKPVAEKLLGIGGDRDEASATVVDAAAEAERLKKNAEDGKPVTEGETPSIEE